MFNHGQHGGTGMLGVEDDAGMAIRKDSKDFIGKSLSYGAYITKIEADFSELFQIGQQTFRL